ncbi:polysaccharide lyase beta-sandwich domain-containing protein [Nonomuraea sp. NPDC050328]|uniref:polysaccharide lyase beta-sandwich domain-containing protein n=1 Tax=Nonomuraea sp. NPDC050328 TaxID=3364361 RepID=UPI0037B7CC8A
MRVPALGLTAVAFWQPGTAGGITASGPCAVLLRGGRLTVADPRDELAELTVTVDGRDLTFPRPGPGGATVDLT